MNAFESMARPDLLRALQMFAKNWLAHDGCWFLAVEERLGMDAAIELDARSWARFAATEARRIMATFAIPAGGGLPALELALGLRMYSLVNTQHTEWPDDGRRLRFFMGHLSGAGDASAQRSARFSVPQCGPGRVRHFREDY